MKTFLPFSKKILLLFMALLLMACADGNSPAGIMSEGTLSVRATADMWTYISLRGEGQVVGRCALADTAAQRAWRMRTDWDLAICNGMIRTNGGASGIGQGAAAVIHAPWEDVRTPVAPAYHTDADTVEVW